MTTDLRRGAVSLRDPRRFDELGERLQGDTETWNGIGLFAGSTYC
jgi:hypothetical protein